RCCPSTRNEKSNVDAFATATGVARRREFVPYTSVPLSSRTAMPTVRSDSSTDERHASRTTIASPVLTTGYSLSMPEQRLVMMRIRPLPKSAVDGCGALRRVLANRRPAERFRAQLYSAVSTMLRCQSCSADVVDIGTPVLFLAAFSRSMVWRGTDNRSQ